MIQGINWRQASGEALLIFAGVLVALAGQAWWEYRGDREAERLELTPASAVPLAASAFSYARLDLSDATFREAVASGRLNTIQDAEVRAVQSNKELLLSRVGG